MRKLRRTIMRYVNVSSILAFTNITRKLRDQYPNYQSFIGKKLLLPHEVILSSSTFGKLQILLIHMGTNAI